MIIDINNNIDSEVSLFADDTRILRPVQNIDDVESLQEDLEKLYRWQENNNKAFSSSKFKLLRYGWNQDLQNPTEYPCPNAEDLIERKECQMSDNGKFSSHVD